MMMIDGLDPRFQPMARQAIDALLAEKKSKVAHCEQVVVGAALTVTKHFIDRDFLFGFKMTHPSAEGISKRTDHIQQLFDEANTEHQRAQARLQEAQEEVVAFEVFVVDKFID